MEKILQISASLIILLVYFIYLKQVIHGKSTPNPGTWIVWLVVMTINLITYSSLTDHSLYKTLITFASFSGVFLIMFYSFLGCKFSKLILIDKIILTLSLAIIVYWLTTKNDELSSLFLQIAIFISFLPTVFGLIQGRLKESLAPWAIATFAYSLHALSLLINYNGNIYEFCLPVINGIMGNGLISIIVIIKNIKDKTRKKKVKKRNRK
ncbi:hypothetical protein EOL94_03640 [bacterium]|nr:hypothetical protein [bacterium]